MYSGVATKKTENCVRNTESNVLWILFIDGYTTKQERRKSVSRSWHVFRAKHRRSFAYWFGTWSRTNRNESTTLQIGKRKSTPWNGSDGKSTQRVSPYSGTAYRTDFVVVAVLRLNELLCRFIPHPLKWAATQDCNMWWNVNWLLPTHYTCRIRNSVDFSVVAFHELNYNEH